jgi:hypothetical protein
MLFGGLAGHGLHMKPQHGDAVPDLGVQSVWRWEMSLTKSLVNVTLFSPPISMSLAKLRLFACTVNPLKSKAWIVAPVVMLRIGAQGFFQRIV